MAVDWIKLSASLTVVANEDEFWLHNSLLENLINDPFVTSNIDNLGSDAAAIETTRNLLEGVIIAAQKLTALDRKRPALSVERFVYRLVGAYHTTKMTVSLMSEVAKRFSAIKRTELSDYANRKVQDEAGHDLFALQDLRGLGYDAEKLVNAIVPKASLRLIELFKCCVERDCPVEAIGYAYAIERLATAVDEKYVYEVNKFFDFAEQGSKTLSVHSVLGADIEHVNDALDVISKLSFDERQRVARTVFQATTLCSTLESSGFLSDQELSQLLSPYRYDNFSMNCG